MEMLKKTKVNVLSFQSTYCKTITFLYYYTYTVLLLRKNYGKGLWYFLYSHEISDPTLLSFSGLQTSQDARFYASSARFEPFSNEGKPLVIQFTVKHEQKIDCGGGYVKVFPSDLEQTNMHGESSYYIMFGK